MKKIILIISLFVSLGLHTRAQCDKTLVDKAITVGGKDLVLVRDFRVKLKEAGKHNPTPARTYTVQMQQGITYNFAVAGAVENEETAILQLNDNSNILGSTYNYESKTDAKMFRYVCQRTGDYQVTISFRNSKTGCAAGVMSMLVNSSLLRSANLVDTIPEEVLYLDMENPLNIVTDASADEHLEVTINSGRILNNNGNYVAIVDNLGNATIKVKKIGSDGKTVEEVSRNFKVERLEAPEIYLERAQDKSISHTDLTLCTKLELKPFAYRIIEFFISSNLNSQFDLQSVSETLTQQQLEFLKSLQSGQRFYIHHIRVERPDGLIMDLPYLEYTVR